jgi:hypothetical protein
MTYPRTQGLEIGPGGSIKNAVVETLGTDPTTPDVGRLWVNGVANKLMFSVPDGGAGVSVFPVATGADIQTLSSQIASTSSNVGNLSSLLTTNKSSLVAAINETFQGPAVSLVNGRTFSVTGDATGTSAAFNGTANASIPLVLANSGVVAATYGSASEVPIITVDAKGRVTGVTTAAISTATLQTSYDLSTAPQITTSAAKGAVTIKRGTTADTDNTLVVQNGANAATFTVKGNGAMTAGATVLTSLDGTPVGVTTAAAGRFTTLQSTGQAALASLTMGGAVITNHGTPINPTDVPNKAYVDQLVANISWKAAVRLATTANVSLFGAATIDGVTPTNGDRILVKNNTTNTQNGIYDYNSSGAWVRSFDSSSGPLLTSGAMYVLDGTTNKGSAWVENAVVTNVGSDPVTYVQLNATTAYTNGAGLGLTGNQFYVLDTTVTPGAYGSASSVATFTVNSRGQLTAAGSTSISIPMAQVTGLGTMAAQNATAVAITGGTINGTSVGATTPAAGAFTTLTAASGQTVLHAGNYNTYAPSLSGTGATGNWNIKSADSDRLGNQLPAYYLQWPGQSLSTGATSFAGLTIASGTTFNVGAMTGVIVDNTTTPGQSTITPVTFAGATGQTSPYIGTSLVTYVLIDNTGALVLQPSFPTSQQRRTMIMLGGIAHPAGTFTYAGNRTDFVQSPVSQLRDMMRPVGFINLGLQVTPAGSNLQIKNNAAWIFGMGINFSANRTAPNETSVPATNPLSFLYRTQTGVGGALVNAIDPASYDVAGTITAIPGGGGQATNQRIYYTDAGVFVVQYGQTIYSNLNNAIAGAATEAFTVYPTMANAGILVGVLSVTKNATNLSNSSSAQFLPVSKFGELTGATAGTTTATLQGSYNNSGVPQITTNATLGAFSLQRGSAADTDNVFVINNGAAAPTFTVTGAGQVVAAGLNATPIGAITPSTGAFTTLTTTSSFTVAGGLKLNQLTTPATPTGAGSSSGGTLAAATYYAKIVAVDVNGQQTLPSTESSGTAVTGSTSSITWNWAAVPGATSYQIWYATASGAQAAYYTSSTNSFVMTAAAGTAGTLPVANRTGSIQTSGAATVGALVASSLNSTPIGATTPSTGAFTTLQSTGATTLGATTATSINSTPIGATTASTGAFTTLSSSGLATLASLTVTGSASFAAINNTPIGNITPSTGAFSTLSSSGATTLGAVTATSLNSTPIGASSASTGAFTTLSTSGLATLNSLTVSGTSTLGAVNATSIGATTPGTGAFTTLSTSGAATLASASVTGALTAGSINSTPIGATTASTGRFTNLQATTNFGVGVAAANALVEVQGTSAAVAPASDQPFPAYVVGQLIRNTSNTNGSYSALTLQATNSSGTVQGASVVAQSVTGAGYSPAMLFIQRTASGTGTEAMRIDSTGNVGVGTTSPQVKLHVGSVIAAGATGTGDGTYQLRRNSDGAVVGSFSADSTNSLVAITSGYETIIFKGSTLERMRIDTAGKVNIGMTGGIRTLNIQNSANAYTDMVLKSNTAAGVAGAGTLYFGNNGSDALAYVSYDTQNSVMGFATSNNGTSAGAEKMRLNSAGELIVGSTAASGQRLVVNGVTRSMQQGNRNSLAFMVDSTAGALAWLQPNLIGHYYTGSQDAVSMRVPASGNTNSGSYDIFLDGTHTWYGQGGSSSTGSSGPLRAAITAGGAFLINTVADDPVASQVQGFSYKPTVGLIVDSNISSAAAHFGRVGDGTVVSFYRNAGLPVGTISITASAVAYNTTSDYRLKNISGDVTAEMSASFIDALQPKVGTWKVDGSKFVGFLAHEFQEVSPTSVTGEKDAVSEDGTPVMQSMQASTPEVMANVIAELQFLRKRVSTLEAEKEENGARFDRLEEMIAQLSK